MPRIEFFSPRFHYTFDAHPPTLTVASGTSLRIICPDSDNMLANGVLLAPNQRQDDPGVLQGNPCAGPIYVEGAKVGDCLEVTIETLELDRDFGQTGLAPNHGLLSSKLLSATAPQHLYRWKIDRDAGRAFILNALGGKEISVPLRPFVGCIGVCPPAGEIATALMSGAHGGNMDLPLTAPGSTVLLPVFRDGGLLMLGDIHAAQGHGEIIGGAIETSGKVDCTIRVIKRVSIPTPRFMDHSSIAAVGLHDDLRLAIEQAHAYLLDWIVSDHQMNRWDAYNLISQCASIVIGNLGLPPYPVAACISRSHLPH